MRAPLRAFVVDDEVGVMRRIARLLRETNEVEVVGTATEPEEALVEIPERDVDVLFLDVEMPRMDGFELLERLPATPLVVFVTGYRQYAAQAFEKGAVNYLVKPVKHEQLAFTIDRLHRLRDDPGRASPRNVLERVADAGLTRARRTYAERVSIDLGQGRARLVEIAHISHFVAHERGTLAVSVEGEHLVDHPLADLELRLDPRLFFRIHRSILLNLEWVEATEPLSGGRMAVRLRGAARTVLEASRQRTRALRERVML